MTSTNNFVGIGDVQRMSSRVLKPPGGGSSIVFGEDDDVAKIKPKCLPQQEAPPVETQEEPAPQPQPETNGTVTPQSVKADAAVTKENNPTPATNGSAIVNGSATTNGSPTTNGSTTSSRSSTATTPTTAKQLDTQSRLFGNEPVVQSTPSRRVRDHYRSNIFTADDHDAKANGTTNETPRAAGNPIVNDTPEMKTPEPQPQQKQRQRVPPGGFSTQLW